MGLSLVGRTKEVKDVAESREVTIEGKTYTLPARGQAEIERLLGLFQKNISRGLNCSLEFNSRGELCLWAGQPEACCGIVKFNREYGTIEEKGEEVHAGS